MDGIRYAQFDVHRNFGVEIEVNAGPITQQHLRNIILAADPYREVRVVENWKQDHNNAHWSVKRDSSCKGNGFDYGWEVSSYVGHTMDDILTIQDVVASMRAAGVRANHRCAVHVHVEVKDFTRPRLAGLVAHWLRLESVVTEMVPHHRIRCVYSKPLTEHHKAWLEPSKTYTPDEFFTKVTPKPFPSHYTGWRPKDRRTAVNLTNYMKAINNPKANYRKTVELRLPEGCVDPRNVSNWTKMFLLFVDRCHREPFPSNTQPVGLAGTLDFLGLTDGGRPVLLSPGMHALKVWLLERVNTHARNPALRTEAVAALNRMCQPLKTYTEKVPSVKKRPTTRPVAKMVLPVDPFVQDEFMTALDAFAG